MHGHLSFKHELQWNIIMHCTISNRYSDSHYLNFHQHHNCAHHGRLRRWSMTSELHSIRTLLTVTRPGVQVVHQQEVGWSQVIAMLHPMTIQNDEH